MLPLEKYESLNECTTLDEWRTSILKFARELGYERSLLAIVPDHNTPLEAQFAFLHHNFSPRWVNKYDEEKMLGIDPVMSHCRSKATPLIWSSETFKTKRQKELYEEASSYGLKAGVTLPINGISGEFGVVSFASSIHPDNKMMLSITRTVPKLSCLRDYITEGALKFIRQPNMGELDINLTRKEIECMKWCVAGKSTWDIAKLMHCTNSAVDHHFANIRRKFGTSTRREAIVKAISLKIIPPA